MRSDAKRIALGGVFAALAVVIMCMGTIIPLATFVCPMFCMVILCVVCRMTGYRIGWAWYICVAVLSMLLAPDKEAAAVFLFLGYYPIVKPAFDKCKLSIVWKLLYFNVSVFAMYAVLIYLLGMHALSAEFAEMGRVVTVLTLLLANICMILVDRLLTMVRKKR